MILQYDTPYIGKAAHSADCSTVFDKEFIDRHCRSSVVDEIKVALSACRCRHQVCGRLSRTFVEQNYCRFRVPEKEYMTKVNTWHFSPRPLNIKLYSTVLTVGRICLSLVDVSR